MNTDAVMDVAINSMSVAILVAAPVLLISIVVGLAVSIFQATTHIQEQTLTFVPKVLSIVGIILILGPWMLSVLTNFVTELFTNMNTMFL
jgi:flagellar biosynthetic protein FliQ